MVVGLAPGDNGMTTNVSKSSSRLTGVVDKKENNRKKWRAEDEEAQGVADPQTHTYMYTSKITTSVPAVS
jgi:hypothetical protein